MGYDVKIINTEKIDDSRKFFNKIEKIRPILTQQFNFVEKYNEGDSAITFLLNGNEHETLAFDLQDKILWAKNPSEQILAIMIDIAKAFNDGSRVLGDNLETYITTQEVYYHEYEDGE